jgi:hypothetical protein
MKGGEGKKFYLQSSLSINQTKEDARGKVREDTEQ